MKLHSPTVRPSRLLASLLLLAAPATAQAVWVVDDTPGPGVDFSTIQPAVDIATSLDRIEVRNGQYPGFIVDHGVTILGENSSQTFAPSMMVAGVATGETVVACGLDVDTITVLDCTGTLVGNDIRSRLVSVTRASDVRFHQLKKVFSRLELNVDDSFVQLTDSDLRGQDAVGSGISGNPGGPAVRASNGSTLFLTDTRAVGGYGESSSLCWGGQSGYGGEGVIVDNSEVRLYRSDIQGGEGGLDCFGSLPPGLDGDAVRCVGAAVLIRSGTPLAFPTCLGTDIPGLPIMTMAGGSVPASTATFSVFGAGGASTRLWVGRRATKEAFPGLEVPRLHSSERGISLGSMPTSGSRILPLTVPSLVPGTLIYAQASRTLSTGSSEFSNSVTLVVR